MTSRTTLVRERCRLLFFTRGRGRGHAVPDMAIVEELGRLDVAADVRFVSYATGAATLREGGWPVIDLGLREDCPFLDLLVRAGGVLKQQRPDVVVSHEDFAVLPATKMLGRPALFIVDFFLSEEHIWSQSLAHADRIVFIEERGVFPEPRTARGKVHYVGPVRRAMAFGRADRASARCRLGLSPDALVVSVIPGAWATEERAPITHLVRHAFAALPAQEKHLFWVAGRDRARIDTELGAMEGVRVLESHSPIEELMVASDVVVTKANRGTTLELSALGVPSVSLSYRLNPVDEALVGRIHTNVALHAGSIDGPFLADVLGRAAATGRATAAPQGPPPATGAAAAAAEIAAFVDEHTAATPVQVPLAAGVSE